MIICTACGHANGADDTFCGSCGGFLEWDGEPAPAQRPAPAPVAVASIPAPRAEPSLPVAYEAAPAPEPLPARDDFSVRVPQAEHERPAPMRPDPVDLGRADLYCGGCGAGNAAGRFFCRRCGASLEDALPDERLSWWRRLWRWLRSRFARRRTYAAGERPDGWAKLSDATSGGTSRRRWWKPRMPARLSLGRAALPLALLSLVGFGIAPVRAAVTTKAFHAWDAVSEVVAPRYVPVSASGARATSAQRGHDASMAIDQNTLTWWAEGREGRGRGERLVVRFDRPVDLSRVTVRVGAAEEAFPFQPRVRGLRVTMRGAEGVVDERRATLADKRGLQQVEVDATGVTQVTLRILSTYAGQKGTAASIAEVGFFDKQ